MQTPAPQPAGPPRGRCCHNSQPMGSQAILTAAVDGVHTADDTFHVNTQRTRRQLPCFAIALQSISHRTHPNFMLAKVVELEVCDAYQAYQAVKQSTAATVGLRDAGQCSLPEA